MAVFNMVKTPIARVSWGGGTNEEIVKIIQSARAGRIDLHSDMGWSVGDERVITISSFVGGNSTTFSSQSMPIVITSFDEYENCGNVLQFDFKNVLTPSIRMSSTSTNVGGYDSTEMYLTTLPSLVNALPNWLKELLLEFSVKSTIGNEQDVIETITGNKLALRSTLEMGATIGTYSPHGEGDKAIDYYTLTANRIKVRDDETASYYWNRSPYVSNTTSFYVVTNSGSVGSSGYGASSTGPYIAPFGCI